MSIETNSTGGQYIENNKLLIPDDYQLREGWCTNYINNTVVSQTLYPWDQKIEKAFFRGSPTGFFSTFPTKQFPEPEKVAEIVLNTP